MPIAKELYSLDFLVYSAHKTGTQSLNQTLGDNGFRSVHCHGLASNKTRLRPALLPILSVVCEPIGGHI